MRGWGRLTRCGCPVEQRVNIGAGIATGRAVSVITGKNAALATPMFALAAGKLAFPLQRLGGVRATSAAKPAGITGGWGFSCPPCRPPAETEAGLAPGQDGEGVFQFGAALAREAASASWWRVSACQPGDVEFAADAPSKRLRTSRTCFFSQVHGPRDGGDFSVEAARVRNNFWRDIGLEGEEHHCKKDARDAWALARALLKSPPGRGPTNQPRS